MIKEIIIICVVAFLVGLIIAWLRMKFFTREIRSRKKILRNPELLVEKLKANGKIIDDGKELKYSVVEEMGKKTIKVESEELEKENPKPKLTPEAQAVVKENPKPEPPQKTGEQKDEGRGGD